jgi:hypothetical protein
MINVELRAKKAEDARKAWDKARFIKRLRQNKIRHFIWENTTYASFHFYDKDRYCAVGLRLTEGDAALAAKERNEEHLHSKSTFSKFQVRANQLEKRLRRQWEKEHGPAFDAKWATP